MTRLAEVGEFRLIDSIARIADVGGEGDVAIGIGDDAALVRGGTALLVTSDSMVEGVHYKPEWLTPEQIGARAFRVSVSDIAAMGGRPRYAQLVLDLNPDAELETVEGIVAGFVGEAGEHGTKLIGGNVIQGPRNAIHATIIGEAGERTVPRGGATVGEGVYVTGHLGDAAAGVDQLIDGLRAGAMIKAYAEPPVRLAVAEKISLIANSMIDISDGLVQDLTHVAEASGVTIELDTRNLPTSAGLRQHSRNPRGYAMSGGEDYEIAFTAPVAEEPALRQCCVAHGCDAYRIGTVIDRGRHAPVVDAMKKDLTSKQSGFRHFRGAPRSSR